MTSNVPRDSEGGELCPFDLVRLGGIPEHYWRDPGFGELAQYGGGYGLITYFKNEISYYDRAGHSGWVNPSGTAVNVVSVRISDDAVCSYSFWLPTASLRRIPANFFIMNIFANLPIQMEDAGAAKFTFTPDTNFYKLVKYVTTTSYGDLAIAHGKALDILGWELA